MQFLFRYLPKHLRRRQQHHRTFTDVASIKHVRDRGLDHAVQREKHLKPMMNLKNLIKSEPSKSLPLPVLTQNKDSLKLPFRPIEFIRKYPSIFQEYLPGGISIYPHIKLTQQVLDLDAEEQLVYESDSYKQNVADRVLKLLMISRIDKIPFTILDKIKWELGLPQDYVKYLVPEFPDCFRVFSNVNNNSNNKNLTCGFDSDLGLELVCWSNELAVSSIEKKAAKAKFEYKKGMPLAFPMKFSKDFEMGKQLKKWFDDWQKLPYISPYENATHLGATTDESDKWTVGVLHEVLNLFVSKKVDKDTLLCLGDWLGIRSRIQRALLHHPGIFYLSSKTETHTVVLRDAYKRGLLIEKSPMANSRNRYVHLMNTVNEDRKTVSVPGGSNQQEKKTVKTKEQGEKDDTEGAMEADHMDSDNEDEHDYEHDDDEDEEGESKTRGRRNLPANRSRMNKKNFNARESSKNAGRQKLAHKRRGITKEVVAAKNAYSKEMRNGHKFPAGSGDKSISPKIKRKLFTTKRTVT